MNKELVTAFGTEDFASIAAATGAYTSAQVALPNLKINRHSEDEAGNTVPVGTYVVTQDDKTLYGKTAKFRAFLNTFQYLTYDNTTNKFVNKSIIVKNFNEQAIDELGGERCGKIPFKEFQTLVEKGLISEEEKIAQRAIKCYRSIYGLLSMEDAVTATGEKSKIEDLPVLWRMSGDSFNAPRDALNIINKVRHLCFQHWLHLDKPERKKQGSNVYYVPVVTVDLANTVEFTEKDMATFAEFQQFIDKENSYVADKWRKAHGPVTTDSSVNVLAELDLNDEVPEL